MDKFTDGELAFSGYKTYYKIFGSPCNRIPLVVLHGGPGSAHNYLLDLQRVSESGRQVVFYDQVGSGLSEGPDDTSQYTFNFFIAQLNSLRAHLSLNEIHLLGHSWGGMLAIEYLLTIPEGVRSLTLASSMVSMPLFAEEVKKLRKQLPKQIQRTLHKYEKSNDLDNPEYSEAYQAYHKQFIFRGDVWPKHLDAPDNELGKRIYRDLWGINEAYPNGSLKKWNRLQDLHKISTPTLITAGKYDELTPRQAVLTQQEISGAERVEFEFSAHATTAEEPQRYNEVICTFLAKTELI